MDAFKAKYVVRDPILRINSLRAYARFTLEPLVIGENHWYLEQTRKFIRMLNEVFDDAFAMIKLALDDVSMKTVEYKQVFPRYVLDAMDLKLKGVEEPYYPVVEFRMGYAKDHDYRLAFIAIRDYGFLSIDFIHVTTIEYYNDGYFKGRKVFIGYYNPNNLNIAWYLNLIRYVPERFNI